MGYESVERDSLITIQTALNAILNDSHYKKSQTFKDCQYESDRIVKELSSR